MRKHDTEAERRRDQYARSLSSLSNDAFVEAMEQYDEDVDTLHGEEDDE